MNIVIFGGTGFVGKNVTEVLRNEFPDLHSFGRHAIDLLHLKTTDYQDKVIRNADYIINCAANVGSLHYVTDNAAEVIDTNSRMILNLYYLLARLESKTTVINPIANCGYPGYLKLYKEEHFWNGAVHESVLSYGSTRRLLLNVARCYEQEHGIKSINYYVPNMYGEYDSTDPNKAHALNALISKAIKATKEDGIVTVWGTGDPIREWLYAKDFGRIVLETIKRYGNDFSDWSENINVGQKYGVSINDLIADIKSVYNKDLRVEHINKPDGAPEKVMDDVHFSERFPHFKFTKFKTGIKETINYYERQYPY